MKAVDHTSPGGPLGVSIHDSSGETLKVISQVLQSYILLSIS